MKITTFHKSNLGSFGDALPCDQEGYVHLTQAGWIRAGYSRSMARIMAKNARNETKRAEQALAEWQGGQCGR